MTYNYYLAGPWFTEKEEEIHNKVLSMIKKDLLVRVGEAGIVNPRDYKVPYEDALNNSEWGTKVCTHDLQSIRRCSIVYAILSGQYMDSGTAMEVGYAHAMGRRVIGIITNPKESYSCMIINSCDILVDMDFHTIEKETVTVK